jgi:hypothetical protein
LVRERRLPLLLGCGKLSSASDLWFDLTGVSASAWLALRLILRSPATSGLDWYRSSLLFCAANVFVPLRGLPSAIKLYKEQLAVLYCLLMPT